MTSLIVYIVTVICLAGVPAGVFTPRWEDS